MHNARIDLSTAEEMLQIIPVPGAGEYKAWAKIARSLASEFPTNEGLEALIAWSNPGSDTKKLKEIRSQWNTFVRLTSDTTIGTLIHHAKENGWSRGERKKFTAEERAKHEALRKQRAAEQDAKRKAAERDRINTLNGLEMVFNNLPDYTGTGSSYLNDKGIPHAHEHCVLKRGCDFTYHDQESGERVTVYRAPDQLPNKGERKGKSWTAWAIYDNEGQFFGFERLYDHRDHNNKSIKRVAARTASNRGWHVFGTPETASQIFVMGGFADAFSAHISGGVTTVTVVGEGNIPAVVTALKAAYPQAKIIAAPDNDEAGLAAAHSAGGFWTVPMADGDDWSDVYLKHGPAEVKHQLLNFVRGFEYHTVNQRYLDIPIREGLNLIKSAKGTGKSFSIAKHVKNNPHEKTLIISYRVLLNQALAKDFEGDFYQDLKAPSVGDALLKESSRLVMQLDSLWRLAGSHWDTVFIDEIDQSLMHFASSTFAHKVLAMDVLTHILRNAKTIILADADLSDLTKDFCNLIGLNSGVLTDNTYQTRKGSTVYLYESRDHLKKHYTDYVEDGGQAFFASNSKGLVRNLNDTLSRRGLADDIQAISADNSSDPEIVELIRNINEHAPNLKSILGSPSIGTGLSIDKHNFKRTYAAFTSTSGTVAQAHQQLARARNVTEFHVYVDPAKRSKLTNEKEIHRLKIQEPCNETAEFLKLDDQGQLVSHPVFEWLYCRLKSIEAKNQNAFKDLFVEQLEREGYTVIVVSKDTAMTEAGALDGEIANSRLEAQIEREIAEADLLTDDQYDMAMMGDGDFSNAAVTKTQIYKDFNFAEFDPDQSDEMLQQLNELTISEEQDRYASALKKLGLAALPADTTRTMDVRNRKHAQSLADHKHYSKRRTHLLKILSAVGVDENLEYDGRSWSNDVCDQLRQWMRRNKDSLYKYSGLSVSFTTLRHPMRWLNGFLRSLGLDVVSSQSRVDGERQWTYRLARVSLERARALIERRNKGIIEHYERADTTQAAVTPAPVNINNNFVPDVTVQGACEPSIHAAYSEFEESTAATEFSVDSRTPEQALSRVREILNHAGVTLERALKLISLPILVDLADGTMGKFEFSTYLNDVLRQEQTASA